MISRSGDLITFECDGEKCHEVFESASFIFGESMSRLRESDWTSEKPGSSWRHFCPSCAEECRKEKQAKMAELAKKFQGE
jgi:hypothetical protein